MKPGAKEPAEELYAELLTEYNAADIGSAAVGLWMAGKNELAVYIMCRVCREDVTNTDNLNNLSAILIMNSGEQLAIPLLNYINKKFPGNSTILNNLGQAWFCLGDIPKAGKYLDSVVRIYAMHPQANFTKSLIEEQKGNKTEAANLIHKSLQHSFSDDKLERLKILGDDLKAGDINLPAKTKEDPLNLGGFTHPDFPKSVDDCFVLKPQWDAFRESIDAESDRLRKMYEDAIAFATEKQKERTNNDIAMVQASLSAGSPQGTFTSLPLYIHKAVPKLKVVTDEYNAKMERWKKKTTAFMEEKGLELRKNYQAEMQRLRDEDGEQTGEGKPNRDYCPRYKETTDNFLRAYNTETEQLYIERLEITKAFLNDMTYYSMYANWPEMFEAIKLQSKMSWLGTLYAQAPNTFEYNMDFVCNKGKGENKSSELAEFDDIACQYHSEMSLIVFKIQTDCSRMTTELDTKFIKLKLKQDMDKETFADKFMK
jgi:tetratricopeptide (TPR) repeat protein